jgi:RND family efflux transporter MFP subunit
LQIRAPFDGVITVRNINLGTYVGPSSGSGNLPLFVIEDHKRLRLVISVPENFTGGLSNKSQVTFTVKALQGEKFSAQVKRLAGALDTKLRSERLEIDILNKDNRLLPNMYADVNVPLPARDSAFVVPKSSVVTSTEKVFVIKVVNNHAQWVNVQKGLEAGDNVAIYGNIKPGDELVKAATEEIRDGATVKRGAAGKTTEDNSEGKAVSGPSGNQGTKKDSSAKK